VQVARLVEREQSFQALYTARLEARRHLDLRHGDAPRAQVRERGQRLFADDREVTEVDADAEMATQDVATRRHDTAYTGHRTERSPSLPTSRPPIDYIERTRAQYSALGYPVYRWVESTTPPPFTPVSKPLSASRLGLIASGGIYVEGQVAFHFADDISYREIATDTPREALRVTHFAYDLTDARRYPNVVFTLYGLRSLVADGVLGELAERAYTFMGGIYSARKVRDVLAPELTRRMIEDQVDLALLVPV